MTDTHVSSEQPAPDLLTIDEAAAVMRVGRTKAYDLARRYLASGRLAAQWDTTLDTGATNHLHDLAAHRHPWN
jgi:hypothetical protein